MQQLGADPILEKGDGAAHRRRRAAELAAGGSQAALVHRKDEHFHRIQTIHAYPPPLSDSGRRLGVPLRGDNRRQAPTRHSYAPRKSVCRTACLRGRATAAYLMTQAS
ncbi:hypothetical protein TM233_20010 [Bradyrhizobium sp. TM233]|nr:hypothetical protein TM233_20010 [Bradyrhizobium sp. TM233]